MTGMRLKDLDQSRRSRVRSGGPWVTALAIGLSIAPAAGAQTPPTNLRVSNFLYAAKVHRFTFEWNAATSAPGRRYAVRVVAVGTGLPRLAANIAPTDVPADHRHPTNPSAVLLDCSS